MKKLPHMLLRSRLKIFSEKQSISALKGGDRLKIGAIIGGAVFMAVLFFNLFPKEAERINSFFSDSFFRLRYSVTGKGEISPYIVPIVFEDAGEDLSENYQRRYLFARLVNLLKDTDVRLIAFDILFDGQRDPSSDFILRKAIDDARRVYLPMVPDNNFVRLPPVEKGLFFPQIHNSGDPNRADGVLLPYSLFINDAAGFGHIGSKPGQDGVNRTYPLFYEYQEGRSIIPSLALHLVCDYLNVDGDAIEIVYGSHLLLPGAEYPNGDVGDIKIPINQRGEMVIPFVGPWLDSFYIQNMKEILRADHSEMRRRELAEIVDNSIVVISDLSTLAKDFAPGIFEEVSPLGGLHLNVVNALLTGNFVVSLGLIEKIALAILTIFLIALLALRGGMGTFLAGSLGLYLLIAGGSFLAFLWGSILWDFGVFSTAYFLVVISLHTFRLQSVKVYFLNRKLEEEKKDNQLLQANKLIALGSLSSSIAHEIANPNSAIASNMTFLQKVFPQVLEHLREYEEESGKIFINRMPLSVISEKINRSLEGSAISASRIEHIVGELRKFYLEKNETVFIDVSVNKVIESALFLTGHKLRKLTVDTDIRLDENLPAVKGDSQKLEQVVINIILNALHGISPKLEGETADRFTGCLVIKSIHDDIKGTVSIIIKDNGVGIDEEHLDKITEPFFSTRLEEGGSGLGLHICKTIITAHKGEIRISSERGTGTSVTIELPTGGNV